MSFSLIKSKTSGAVKERLSMNSNEINQLAKDLFNAKVYLNEQLLPNLKLTIKQRVDEYKQRDYERYQADIPAELYQITLDGIPTLSNHVLKTRLFQNYIPLFYNAGGKSIPKETAELFWLEQISLQIEKYLDQYGNQLSELEKVLNQLEHNDLGTLINIFQSRQVKQETKQNIQLIEDNYDLIEDFISQVVFWKDEFHGDIPVKEKVKKSKQFYLDALYQTMHPHVDRLLSHGDVFITWVLNQVNAIVSNLKEHSYPVYHEQMIRLWNKLQKEQATKDIASYSIRLLGSNEPNFPNLDSLIADNVTLQDLAIFSPQELKAQYAMPLIDTEKIITKAKQVVEKLSKEAFPIFNAESLTADKLRFLSLLKFCNDYSFKQKAQEKQIIQSYRSLLRAKSVRDSIAITNYDLNFVSAYDYIDWHKATQSIYQSALVIHQAGDNLKFDELPDNSLKQIKADFIANGAIYFSLIEKLTGQGKNQITATLPKAIVEQVNHFPLITKDLSVNMRAYQDFGTKYILSYRNVLLGDEMGLGKTIQAIGVINHLYQIGSRYAIVVCPLSILENWKIEIHKWSKLPTYVFRNVKRDKEYQSWLDQGGVLLTNYEQCSRLIEKKDLGQLDVLIVDEAHYIKNPEAKRSQNVYLLANKASYKLFMTGTPLENNVSEMKQLIQVLNPALSQKIRNAFNAGQLSDSKFKEMIATVYLRRKRKEVLKELPKMSIIERWSTFNEEEQHFYDSCIEEGLGGLVKMRRAAFIDNASEKIAQIKEIASEAKQMNRKVIVFSFFKRDVLFKLAKLLPTSMNEVLSGDISPSQRQQLISDFTKSTKYNVLLSQIEAGGVGLNIQTANIVILCEPQWKPSTEQQAISRVYRMGQTKDVIVYRLLTLDSIDADLVDLIDFKQLIFDTYANDSAVQEAFIAQKQKENQQNIKGIKAKVFQIEKHRLNQRKNKEKQTSKEN